MAVNTEDTARDDDNSSSSDDNAKGNGDSYSASGSGSSSNSSYNLKTLFGIDAEPESSVPIFSGQNPSRRKPSDRSQIPQQQQLGLGIGLAEYVDEYENPSFAGVKKRKRREQELGLEFKKSKRDEPKISDFDTESEEDDEGKTHSLGFDLKELSMTDKGKNPNLGLDSDELPKTEGGKKKRKRDEIEAEYAALATNDEGEGGEGKGLRGKVVGEKRKKTDDPVDMVVSEEGFDDEPKLLRTVFVRNLPMKVKKKTLFNEFSRFGEIESLRIRSIPLLETKKPRKGAIIQKTINVSVDSVHAYIVFKTDQSAQASLAHNLALVGENHIHVERGCPPLKKLKRENVFVYDDKRTVFLDNLPFDVKDEEIYQFFSGIKELEYSIEAIQVIRDSGTSVGKGVAYVLFKTRGAANFVVKKHPLKLRDRELRISYANSNLTPSKRKNSLLADANNSPTKKLAVGLRSPDNTNKVKIKVASSYQGLRASKLGDQKNAHWKVIELVKLKSCTQEGEKPNEQKGKRLEVAPRKDSASKDGAASKQAGTKRKLESQTSESVHSSKKTRKFR